MTADAGLGGSRKVPRFGRFIVVVFMVAVLFVVFWAGSHAVYRDVEQDPLHLADAIVVLGGEHDGREDYGLQLANEGYASVVLISDSYRPYSDDAALMSRVCSAGNDTIEVICESPTPSTTQGEAKMVERIAQQLGWRSVIVVTWSFHIPRARYIFDQCFDGKVTMREMPRTYDRPPWRWAYTYAYQSSAFAKAAIVGCSE